MLYPQTFQNFQFPWSLIQLQIYSKYLIGYHFIISCTTFIWYPYQLHDYTAELMQTFADEFDSGILECLVEVPTSMYCIFLRAETEKKLGDQDVGGAEWYSIIYIH